MKKLASLQAKDDLLKQAMALEQTERESEVQQTLEDNEEMKKQEKLRNQLNEEMELCQEEAKRKYLADEFNRDAKHSSIPSSYVRLQQEQSCTLIFFSTLIFLLIFSYFFVASITKLRRNCRGVLDYCKEGHENDKLIIAGINELKTLYLDVKKELSAFSFHMKMQTDDVSQFFPANDNETILKFMNEDEQFNARRHGFDELLKTTISHTSKKFHEALLNTLFTVHYKSNTRWPCFR